MGSEWPEMGKALMNLPVFAESVYKCDAVLKPYKIDIIQILTAEDSKMFDNIVNSFVGITTMQIGLVDLLTYLGIKPDYIIGHSLGEIGCGYADGCLSAEQAVLNALFRGLASVETETPKGSMAAVGLGYEDIKLLCPSDIDVACHNSAKSSTISGPEESMKIFISSIQEKGIFTKVVQTSNIAYHSRYIEPAGSKLLEYLKKIIPDSKRRSEKWLSTSIPISEWNTTKARFSSAEYYTNNLLNPVLFEEVIKKIPNDAITIEIAPHGLMQSILKKALPNTVTNLSLSKKLHQNNVEIVMDAIGKLYINSGYRASITKLYPKISYPVSTGTQSMSPLIKWDKSEVWYKIHRKLLHLIQDVNEKIYKIDLNDEAWEFLRGHRIGNVNILPCSLYLKLVFLTLEASNNSKCPIVFENIIIHRNQCITEGEILELTVMIQAGSGSFEVTVDGELLCDGIVKKIESVEQKQPIISNSMDRVNEELQASEIYSELFLRGYHYTEPLKPICKYNSKKLVGELFYQKDWDMFLEGMLQVYMYKNYMRTIEIPLKIGKIVVDVENYKAQEDLKVIPVSINENLNIVYSCGIKISDIQLTIFKQNPNTCSTNLKEIKFIFHVDETPTCLKEFANLVLEILFENKVKGNIIQIIQGKSDILDEVQKSWHTILNEIPKMQFKLQTISFSLLPDDKRKNIALQCFFDLETMTNSCNLHPPQEGEFLLVILNKLNEGEITNTMQIFDLGIILKNIIFNDQHALLLRKRRVLKSTCILECKEQDLKEFDRIVGTVKFSTEDRILFLNRCQHSSLTGEVLKILSANEDIGRVQFLEILDSEAPNLSLDDQLFQNQLQLDLKFNILTPNNKWGSRRAVSIINKRHKVANWMAFQTCPGDRDSLDWVEQSCENVEHTKRINVKYATINTFDVLLANENEHFILNENYCDRKRIKDLKMFGLEYAGTNSNGERIMGLSGSGTLCSFTVSDSELIWEIPNSWSLKEAATVPLAYTTAYMALYLKIKIDKGTSIFIYDGSCALGQAMIALALNEGLQVFSTYRNKKEKELLKLQFLSLNEDQLICLKDSFEDDLLSLTKGEGIDILIYNSYNVIGFESCLKCIKDFLGRFIIVGQIQESFKTSLGMHIFLKHLSLYSIIPHNLVNVDVNTKKILNSLMKDGLRKGVIKPIFSNLYSKSNLKRALSDANNGACFGKIVIQVQSQDSNPGSLVISRFSCFKERTYLILIDNWHDIFGIKLIDFLIENGAKDIVVFSINGSVSKDTYYNHLKIYGESEVRVYLRDNLDLSKNHHVKALLNETMKLNPIDAIFDLQRMTQFSENLTEYFITKNVFEETKKVCLDLRHFVICTILEDSVLDLNTFFYKNSNLVTLCEERINEGLPTKLALWSPIEEIVEIISLTKKRNLLSILQCKQELNKLMILPSGKFIISPNSPSDTKLTADETEISEKELFENYIFNRL